MNVRREREREGEAQFSLLFPFSFPGEKKENSRSQNVEPIFSQITSSNAVFPPPPLGHSFLLPPGSFPTQKLQKGREERKEED